MRKGLTGAVAIGQGPYPGRMARSLLPDQRCRLRVHDLATGEALSVFESDSVLVEAPNWTPDGAALIVNGDGGLFRLPLVGPAELEPIPLDGVPAELNNDHVLASSGGIAYVSARDGHLYAVQLDGSAPARRLTAEHEGVRFRHYLHGISPDGATLALIGGGDASGAWRTDVYTMPSGGGALTALTDDAAADDGVDFCADGRTLVFNSERAGGGAQLFRIGLDGSGLTRLVESDTVDWFPHESPDGAHLLYLSYPAGTTGHPENVDVELRLLELEDRQTLEPGRVLQRLHGGQGTINVSGWAPDSTRFAYADYPRRSEPESLPRMRGRGIDRGPRRVLNQKMTIDSAASSSVIRAPLGDSGIDVFPLSLGGNVFGWTAGRQTSFDVLDGYTAAGGDFIDTADSYSAWVPGNRGGESETIIGEWLSQRLGSRDDVVIATKVSRHPQFIGLAPDTVRAAARASLERLGTDRIDLYYAHFDDEAVPMTDIAAVFSELVDQGLIRAIGVSNFRAERIAEWLRVAGEEGLHKPVALQPHYNLVERGIEADLLPLAREAGLAVVPYYALASGFLSGKYRDGSTPEGPRADGAARYLDARGRRVLASLDAAAEAHGAEVATVALAWLRSQPGVVAPIASARVMEQLPALVASASLELSTEELAALDEASRA